VAVVDARCAMVTAATHKEVVGPDDSKDKWWWLPWRLVERAVPVISGVHPKARADDIDGDQGDACGGKK